MQGCPRVPSFLSCSKQKLCQGDPQAILLNIQYTLLMMLHVYIVDQLQVGLQPTIDLTPTAVMRLATMTRVYRWCHGPLGTGLQQSGCSMPKLNHPEICVQGYLCTISTIQGDFRKIISETLTWALECHLIYWWRKSWMRTSNPRLSVYSLYILNSSRHGRDKVWPGIENLSIVRCLRSPPHHITTVQRARAVYCVGVIKSGHLVKPKPTWPVRSLNHNNIFREKYYKTLWAPKEIYSYNYKYSLQKEKYCLKRSYRLRDEIIWIFWVWVINMKSYLILRSILADRSRSHDQNWFFTDGNGNFNVRQSCWLTS